MLNFVIKINKQLCISVTKERQIFVYKAMLPIVGHPNQFLTYLVGKYLLNFHSFFINLSSFFITPMFEGLVQLLIDLYNSGFVCGFRPFNHNGYDLVEILLRYDITGGSLYIVSKTVWKPSRDIVAWLPELKSERMIEPFSIGIIRTAKLGITTIRRAVNEKTGGSYLAKTI